MITIEVKWVEDGEEKVLKAETGDFEIAWQKMQQLEKAYKERIMHRRHVREIESEDDV